MISAIDRAIAVDMVAGIMAELDRRRARLAEPGIVDALAAVLAGDQAAPAAAPAAPAPAPGKRDGRSVGARAGVEFDGRVQSWSKWAAEYHASVKTLRRRHAAGQRLDGLPNPPAANGRARAMPSRAPARTAKADAGSFIGAGRTDKNSILIDGEHKIRHDGRVSTIAEVCSERGHDLGAVLKRINVDKVTVERAIA